MPIKPFKPAPDEFVLSHLGRFRAWHDIRNRRAALRQIRELVSKETGLPPGAPVPYAAAAMAGLPADQYVQLHTMLPFMRFAAASHALQAPGSLSASLVTKGGCETPRTSAYLCPACVEEDLVRGYSYWRREHQLPGRFWCTSHGTVRLLKAVALEPFWELPQHWLKRGLVRNTVDFERPTEASPIAKFHEVTRTMLDAPIVRRLEAVRWALERQFRKCIQPTACDDPKWNQEPTFSHLVQKAIPEPLCRELFCWRSIEPYGRGCREIDVAVMSIRLAPEPVSTALAMTLLFDTVEEAFSAIATGMEGTPKVQPRPMTPNVLAQTFIECLGSISMMAVTLNSSLQWLIRTLRDHRLEVIHELGDQKVERAFHLIQEGSSISDAIDLTGAQRVVVERVVWLMLGSVPAILRENLGRAPSFVVRQMRPWEPELQV